MAPGEMEKIMLPKSILESVNKGEIIISVEKEN